MALALSGATMACLSVKYGIPILVCEELPDGSVETPAANGCEPCTEAPANVPGSECVNGVVIFPDAGPADSGPADGIPDA